jgi:uncharacterized membrane protein YcaP (DUF421 family)
MNAGRLWAVVGATVAIYLFVLLLLRVSGRRQLAELTVIDLVVVLVLGSSVETAMIRGDTSLAAGLVAAATLLVTNRLLTVAMLRSKRFRHFVGGGPVLLVHNGKVLDEHLRRSGVSRDDLAAALRARGDTNPERVQYAVLETDGTITVVDRDAGDTRHPNQR